MLLAIDIGNSLIKMGVFRGSDLSDKFTIPTKRDYAAEELRLDRLKAFDIETVVVSSVVPELAAVVREASHGELGVMPTFIDHSANFGFTIDYDPPESIGIDRLVNASAAAKKYGTPVIVCSFGTATVIDAVGIDRVFLGGIIAPGVETMAKALSQTTSQLPVVEIEEPDRLICNTTRAAIRSGIVNGHIAMAEGLIEKISCELRVSSFESGSDHSKLETRNPQPKVVATGGFANLIGSKIDSISRIDENLTLDGLRFLA
jgi:type III pantothenate kinase